MYKANIHSTWEQFQSQLSGTEAGLVGVVYTCPLSAAATRAVENSAQALGYGNDACTYVCCTGLGAKDLFRIVEANSPLVLIATDTAAATVLAQAYGRPCATGDANRLGGRSTVAFVDFNALMESDEGKQRAWALLKRLPKFGEI